MNNRALTLSGANSIFEVINVEIQKHALGYYFTTYLDERIENKTLRELCQTLICRIAGARNES